MEPVTEEVSAFDVEEQAFEVVASTGGGRFSFLRADSPVPTIAGVVLIAAGFGMVAYTWGRVAGLTSVALQLPYMVSGGLTALGLILVGLTVVSVAVRRRDAADRARQVEQLASIVRELGAEPPRRARRR